MLYFCGVFLFCGQFGRFCFLSWKKAKRRIASIGKGYPFRIFARPRLMAAVAKMLFGKRPKPSKWKGAICTWAAGSERHKLNSE